MAPAATRFAFALVTFASLIQVLLADDPPCNASEVGTLKCDTKCGTVGLCTGVGTGFNTWVPLETCTEGYVCDDSAERARCMPAPAPTCRANPNPVPTDIVTCMDVGKYPSYENCYYYHDCTAVGGSASPVSCPQGYAFDSCSGTCVAGACTPGEPVHCQDGDVGVDPANNRNYYYCFGNRRYWFSCEAGSAYAVVGRMCVLTTLTNGCLSCYGRTGNALFGGDETCRYLYCAGTGNIEVRTCNAGYYFRGAGYLYCVPGPCYSTIP